MSVPELKGFNFQGGLSVSPEFTALLLGLALYTAAFVAEAVRAGIQSVSKGQREAAMSIGLRTGQVLQLVILPQALRVIIPPLTSQMLSLTKNSSLAVAIGYPDFVSVAGTAINQTGQAIEGVAMIMLVYLVFSLSTSAFMNWYNKKIALVER
jgi:general L-amino acid transport system permease protein